MITVTCTGAMAYIFYNFGCCSHKCLYDKAGAATFIDTFQLGTSDSITCRGIIATTKKKHAFYFVYNIYIGLPGLKIKIWRKQGLFNSYEHTEAEKNVPAT